MASVAAGAGATVGAIIAGALGQYARLPLTLPYVALVTMLVGVGGGLSFLAGLTVVGNVAPPEHRAEVTSAFYVACYLGFSIPALAIGLAATRIGLSAALTDAAVVLGVLAVATMLLTTERHLQQTSAADSA